ncbi:hypothetical protein ABT032_04075, partial [Streptomyces flaveus]
MDDSGYYIPALAMAIALAVKTPALLRSWHDPLQRSVCTLIALSGLVFFFAAPPTIADVNRLTGIENVSAPLVYGLLGALSAACLVVIIHWRGGGAGGRPRAAPPGINRYGKGVFGRVVVVVRRGAAEGWV